MKYFLMMICMLSTVLSNTLWATSFTADAVQIRGENVSRAKMYWLDGNVRFEYSEDGVPMAQIFDNKNNKIIWLDMENKLYLEQEMSASEKMITATKNNQTTDPCKQFDNAECVFLKKTEMNGRQAEKWLITLNFSGNDYHIFQWIDTKYKNILRQENSDGSGISVYIKENQEINGRKVREQTMISFGGTGQQQATQWYDNELDIVVRQEYQSDVVDELQNIKIGNIGEDLFSIPADYTVFDNMFTTVQQEQTN